jgi:hypothetical protein
MVCNHFLISPLCWFHAYIAFYGTSVSGEISLFSSISTVGDLYPEVRTGKLVWEGPETRSVSRGVIGARNEPLNNCFSLSFLIFKIAISALLSMIYTVFLQHSEARDQYPEVVSGIDFEPEI